jgi:hypothetical protein
MRVLRVFADLVVHGNLPELTRCFEAQRHVGKTRRVPEEHLPWLRMKTE